MRHKLTDGEQAMLLAIAMERHPSWRSQTLPGYSIQRSLTADQTKGFALVETTARPDCGFLSLMMLIEQFGTETESETVMQYVLKDGIVLLLFRDVPVTSARTGWSQKFATLVDEPVYGRDRPAISASKSGHLWVEDAMHNSYELSLAEVEKLLEEVTLDQRALLERMLEEAKTPRPS